MLLNVFILNKMKINLIIIIILIFYEIIKNYILLKWNQQILIYYKIYKKKIILEMYVLIKQKKINLIYNIILKIINRIK